MNQNKEMNFLRLIQNCNSIEEFDQASNDGFDPMNNKSKDQLTILHYAAYNNKFELFQYLWNKFQKLQTVTSGQITLPNRHQGENVMHCAAMGRDLNNTVLLFILKQGVFDINSRDANKNTPLHCAVRHELLSNVQILLGHGANIEAKNQQGTTALQIAAEVNNSDLVEYLIKNGANKEALSEYKWTIMHWFAFHDNIALFKKYWNDLKNLWQSVTNKHSSEINKTRLSFNALHMAVDRQSIHVLMFLLEQYKEGEGIDLSTKAAENETPLHLAIKKKFATICRLLIVYGANVHLPDHQNQTCLQLLKTEIRRNSDFTRELFKYFYDFLLTTAVGHDLLLTVADSNHAEILVDLLIQNSRLLELADIGVNKADIAILTAGGYGIQNLVDYWLKREFSSLKAKDKNGQNILMMAAKNNKLEIVRWLVVEKKMTLSAIDSAGNTACFIAAIHDAVKIVEWFLNYVPEYDFFLKTDFEIIFDNNLYLYVAEDEGKTRLFYATNTPIGAIIHAELTTEDLSKDSLQQIIIAIKKKELQTISKEDKDKILTITSIRGHIHTLKGITERNEFGKTFLEVASDSKSFKTIKYLFDYVLFNICDVQFLKEQCLKSENIKKYLLREKYILLGKAVKYRKLEVWRFLFALEDSDFNAAALLKTRMNSPQDDLVISKISLEIIYLISTNQSLKKKAGYENFTLADLHVLNAVLKYYESLGASVSLSAEFFEELLNEINFRKQVYNKLENPPIEQKQGFYQLELRNALRDQLSQEPNTFYHSLNGLIEQITQLSGQLQEVDKLISIARDCKYPSNFLNHITPDKILDYNKPIITFKKGVSHDNSFIFNKMTAHIDNLTSYLKNDMSKKIYDSRYTNIRSNLSQLIVYYENYRKSVKQLILDLHKLDKNDKNYLKKKKLLELLFNEPYQLHVLALGSKHLAIETQIGIAPTKGQLEITSGNVPFGSHIVRKTPDGRIHLKYHGYDSNNPCLPAIEHAVAGLYDVLTVLTKEHGVAPIDIVRLHRSDYNQLLIASLTIDGINLFEFLDSYVRKHGDYLEKFEPYSFSAMIMTSVLSQSADGKADNYMVQIVPLNQRSKELLIDTDDFLLRIVGIDNDVAFLSPIIRKRSDKHVVEMKNIFYFLPQMQNQIDERFLNDFLNRSSILMILDWIDILAKNQRYYYQLFEAGILTNADKDSMKLPIRFRMKTISQLYKDICRLQKHLKEAKENNLKITHMQLLHYCYPHVAQYYERFPKQQSIEDPFNAAEELLLKQGRMYSNPPSLEELGIDIKQEMDYSNIITEGDSFLADEISILTSVIDFGSISAQMHEIIFLHICNYKDIKQLTLRNAVGLNNKELTHLFESLPILEDIRLIGCPNITVDGIREAIYNRLVVLPKSSVPAVGVLYCKGCSHDHLEQFIRQEICVFNFIGLSHETNNYEIVPFLGNSNLVLHRLLTNQIRPSIAQLLLLWLLGADFNCQNESQTTFNGYRPLHIAAKQNSGKSIHRLIELGADPSLPDKTGETPYKKAAKYGLFSSGNALRYHMVPTAEENQLAKENAAIVIQGAWRRWK